MPCADRRTAVRIVALSACTLCAGFAWPLFTGCSERTNPFKVAPEILYPDTIIAQHGQPIDTIEVEITKSGIVDSFTVIPPLPEGLILDSIQGTITGTATGLPGLSTHAVTAHNEWGVSNVETIVVAVSPPEPAGLAVRSFADDSAVLTWHAVAGADSYYVYRAATSPGSLALLASVADTVAVDRSSLTTGTIYFYCVTTTVEGAPESPRSDTVSVLISDILDTVAPRVRITSPGSDTAVSDTAIMVHYTMDDAPRSRTVSLVEGENVVVIDTSDASGNRGADTVTIVCDTMAPVVVITSPASDTLVATPQFTVHYSVDGETRSRVVDLAEGLNTVVIDSTDLAGNRGADTVGVVLDTSPSTIQIIFPARDTLVCTATLEIIYLVESTQIRKTITLTEGLNVVMVDTSDSAGNTAADTVHIRLDTTPPEAPTVAGETPTADNSPTWTWTPGLGDGMGRYRCRLNNPNLGSGATVVNAMQFTPSTPLTSSRYTLYVQERDSAGNWSASGSFAIVVDVTPPNQPLVRGPVATNRRRPAWAWGSGGGGGNGQYRYRVDNPDLTVGTQTTSALTFTPSSDLAPGKHTLYVQERDSLGNWSTAGSAVVGVWPNVLFVDSAASGGGRWEFVEGCVYGGRFGHGTIRGGQGSVGNQGDLPYDRAHRGWCTARRVPGKRQRHESRVAAQFEYTTRKRRSGCHLESQRTR